jgi:NhaA family Na+:H+ antiporter
LEIKQELLIDELNTVRKASSLFFAALQGVLIPIALFFLWSKNQSTSNTGNIA